MKKRITIILFCGLFLSLLILPMCSLFSKKNPADADDVAIDDIKPAVSLSGSMDSVVYLDTITLSGTISDSSAISSVEISVGNNTVVLTEFTDTSWTVRSLELQPGLNSVLIKVEDEYENVSNMVIAQITYERAPQKPVNFTLTKVDNNNVRIEWKDKSISEEGFKVWRKEGNEGDWVVLDTVFTDTSGEGGTFSYLDSAGLIPGKFYSYKISAYNEYGDVQVEPKVIILEAVIVQDSIGPEIIFVSPQSEDSVGVDSVTLIMSVVDTSSDSGGVKSVVINESDTAQVAGNYYRSARKVGLENGKNKIGVSACDLSGNITNDTIILYYDAGYTDNTAPIVDFFTPEQNDTVSAANLMITGTIIEPSGVKEMTVNDGAVELSDGFNWIAAVTLDAGINQIPITVVDLYDNQLDTVLTLVYDSSHADEIPPVIQIKGPQQYGKVRTDTVTVWGTVYDPSGIDSVLVNGDTATIEFPLWSKLITLEHGYDTITVEAYDGSEYKNKTTAMLYVLRNDRPTFFNIQTDTILLTDQAYYTTVSAFDYNDDRLLFYLLSPPSPADAEVEEDSGVVYWKPKNKGDYELSVMTFDGYETDTLSWGITVGTHPPEFLGHLLYVIDTVDTVGNEYSAALGAKDNDDEDTLVYRLLVAPTYCEIESLSGAVTWVPAFEDTGTHDFSAVVVDPEGLSDTLTWRVRILQGEIRSPMFTTSINPEYKSDTVGNKYTLDLNATDLLPVKLTYSLAGKPEGMSIDTAGVITWWTAAADTGANAVMAVVSNTQGRSDTLSWLITIYKNNLPPVFPAVTSLDTALDGQLYTKTLTASHPYGEQREYLLTQKPSAMSIDGSGIVSWTPDLSRRGTIESVTAVCTTASGLADTVIWNIYIPEKSPMFVTSPESLDQSDTVGGQNYSVTLIAADDIPGDLTYSIATGFQPSGLTITKTSRTSALVQWAPDTSHITTSPNTVKAVVSNTAGRSDTLSWEITVIKDNQPASFTTTDLLDTINTGAAYLKIISATHPYAGRPYKDHLTFTVLSDTFTGIVCLPVNDTAAQISWIASWPHIGANSLFAQVMTSAGIKDTLSWQVYVPNRAPAITSDTAAFNRYVRVGTTYTQTVAATDPDGESVQYSLLAPQDPNASIDPTSGQITWNLDPDSTLGYRIIKVSAADGNGGSDTIQWQVVCGDPSLWNLGMKLVPAGDSGSFWMGDTFVSGGTGYQDLYGRWDGGNPWNIVCSDTPVHQVTLSNNFYMDSTEVTYQDYVLFEPGHDNGSPSNLPSDSTEPAKNMTWNKAAEYCNWKSKRVGLDTCYVKNGTTYDCVRSKNGYRIPTEAEWEFAARGYQNASPKRYPWGNDSSFDTINVYAKVYILNGNDATPGPVAQRIPNDYGIYDLIGNVEEWCNDWYDSLYYASSPATDPNNGTQSGLLQGHSKRGGSTATYVQAGWQLARSCERYHEKSANAYLGFRCVRNAE